MKMGNIIDLIMHQDLRRDNHAENETSVSDELKTAIQSLIYRLRELGPIQNN